MEASSYPTSHAGPATHKIVVAIGLVLTLFVAMGGTAVAQTTTDRGTQLAVVRPGIAVDTLRLSCAPQLVDGQRGVLCEWSAATNPQTRGYKLFRIVDGAPRELVASVGVNGRLGYFDAAVSAPSLLTYGVVSVNHNGRLTGRSAPVHVRYGQDVEQLRMFCTPDSLDGKRGVLCRWSALVHPDARGYLVYRIVNDEPREVIARISVVDRPGYFDTDVQSGALLTYGVTAVDSFGSVIGIGGPQEIMWPANR